MSGGVQHQCEFVTHRLAIGPWAHVAGASGLDLAAVVADILTVVSTAGLPEPWRGDYSIERATTWIAERDAESPTLLVTEIESGKAIGLVILVETPVAGGAVDMRIGYVIAERAWSRGFGSEVLVGLATWALSEPSIRTLTAGVDVANGASVRVLEKSGFEQLDADADGTATYQIDVGNEWDSHATDWDADTAVNAYAEAVHLSLTTVLEHSAISLDAAEVLDFGCGTGSLTGRLAESGASVLAFDTSGAMLEILDAKIADHGWHRVHTTATLPIGAPRFDLIVCSSVCSFLDDYPGTVAKLTSLLQPGGMVVQWDWERTDSDTQGLTRRSVRTALVSAGLNDVVVDTAFTVQADTQTMEPLIGHGRLP